MFEEIDKVQPDQGFTKDQFHKYYLSVCLMG